MAVKSMHFHTVSPVLRNVVGRRYTLVEPPLFLISTFGSVTNYALENCGFFYLFFKCLPSSGNTDLCTNLKAVTWRLNS